MHAGYRQSKRHESGVGVEAEVGDLAESANGVSVTES